MNPLYEKHRTVQVENRVIRSIAEDYAKREGRTKPIIRDRKHARNLLSRARENTNRIIQEELVDTEFKRDPKLRKAWNDALKKSVKKVKQAQAGGKSELEVNYKLIDEIIDYMQRNGDLHDAFKNRGDLLNKFIEHLQKQAPSITEKELQELIHI